MPKYKCIQLLALLNLTHRNTLSTAKTYRSSSIISSSFWPENIKIQQCVITIRKFKVTIRLSIMSLLLQVHPKCSTSLNPVIFSSFLMSSTVTVHGGKTCIYDIFSCISSTYSWAYSLIHVNIVAGSLLANGWHFEIYEWKPHRKLEIKS